MNEFSDPGFGNNGSDARQGGANGIFIQFMTARAIRSEGFLSFGDCRIGGGIVGFAGREDQSRSGEDKGAEKFHDLLFEIKSAESVVLVKVA
jgi:hypothetical protein